MEPYPERKPYDTGMIDVGDGHNLYYERQGNPRGKPVVYLHGGPGCGCAYTEYRMFNPDHFNVLMFDQRGSGKSTPAASTDFNTMAHLVGDLELLRTHFGHERWSVAGGSFGSALGMSYAAVHPDKIDRMLLRGIFFADRAGADHISEAHGAAATQWNPWFDEYQNFIPADERKYGLIGPYHRRMNSDDEAIQLEAARLFTVWDTSLCTVTPDLAAIDAVNQNPRDEGLAMSKIWFHYCVREFRDGNRERLLAAMQVYPGTVDIIHGAHDHITPVANARALHDACGKSRLNVVLDGGHLQKDPPLRDAFIAITNRWMQEDSGRAGCPAPSP